MNHIPDRDAIIDPNNDSTLDILRKFNNYHQLPIIWQNSNSPRIIDALFLYHNSALNQINEKRLIAKATAEQL